MHNSNIRHKILTIPGLYNSGPTHWQSLWERSFNRCERIELGDWDEPVKDDWVEKIAEAIDAEHEPVLVAAHSLGCHAFAHWFAAASSVARDRIAGALLVAARYAGRKLYRLAAAFVADADDRRGQR
ncbi:MAG: hypothetical protein EOP63_07515 [Sphingomonadales bacterium]|nr:MAG: hypothetical protein EOP63_07515 [Sphingomonadales bacterium]